MNAVLAVILVVLPVSRYDWLHNQTDTPYSGRAAYMNPGIMRSVYRNRLRWGQVSPCEECVGMVAMPRAGDIGRKICIERPINRRDGVNGLAEETEIEGPFLVVDVVGWKDVEHVRGMKWGIDVDHATADRWGMAGYTLLWVKVKECEEDGNIKSGINIIQ